MTAALAVGGLLALLGLLVLALVKPETTLLVLVALDISNINQVIADHVGISPYRPLLALALVALFVLVRRRRFRLRWSPVTLGLLILYAGFCLSLVNAADPVASQSLLLSRGRDLLYYLVVLALVLSLDKLWAVAAVSVLVLSGLAGLTGVHEFLLGNKGDLFGLSSVPLVQEGSAFTQRHAGTSSDVNFWSRLLILLTPLSLSLWAAGRGRWPRLLWLGCAVSLLLGVYLTQSRGGFIALFVAVVVWLLLAGGRYRTSVLFIPLALVVLVPLTGIGSRLQTLTAVASSSTATADQSVVTRERLQIDALRMFADSPLTGHGIGSYGSLFPRYDRLANYYQPVDIVVAAHNFYLEQAADGGVFLLLAWAIFLGTLVLAALRTRARALRSGDDTARFLAVGIVAGIVGWAIASVFLHLSDFRALLVVAVLAAALDLRSSGVPPVVTTTDRPAPISARLLACVLAGAGAIAFVGVLSTSDTTYVSQTTLGVETRRTADPSTAYQLDVASRGQIVPTLAAVVDKSLSGAGPGRSGTGDTSVVVGVAQSRLGGAVLVTVTAASDADARRAAAAAVELGRARVAALQDDYVLKGEVGAVRPITPLRRRALLPLGLFVVAAVAVAVRRRPAARPPLGAGLLAGRGQSR